MVRQTLFWIGVGVVVLAAYVCIRLANVWDPRILMSFVACVPALLVVMLTSTRRIGEDEFLVVTGKGSLPGAAERESGVLRRLTPHWLAAAEWRALVLGFEAAGRGHGGDGALYVRLRRRAG